MPEVVVAAYPKGAQMNYDYYLKKHVPMVFDLWQPYAKSWRAERPSLNSESPYEFIIFIEMDNAGDFGRAMGALNEEERRRIDDDLENYAKKPPVFWTMERIGAGPA